MLSSSLPGHNAAPMEGRQAQAAAGQEGDNVSGLLAIHQQEADTPSHRRRAEISSSAGRLSDEEWRPSSAAAGQSDHHHHQHDDDNTNKLEKPLKRAESCRRIRRPLGEGLAIPRGYEQDPDEHDQDEDDEPTSLLYCSRERLRLKDFSSEIRASMDVEQFVHQAELVLDLPEVSVAAIVDSMLVRVSGVRRARPLADSGRDSGRSGLVEGGGH